MLKKHLNRKGAKNAKEKLFVIGICIVTGLSEYQMDLMPLFCELGNKPPIPAYPISLRLRVFAVNELGFLG